MKTAQQLWRATRMAATVVVGLGVAAAWTRPGMTQDVRRGEEARRELREVEVRVQEDEPRDAERRDAERRDAESRDRSEGEPRPEERQRFGLIRELQQRIQAAERELAQARERGESGEDITRRLDEMRARFRELTQNMRGRFPAFSPENRESFRERLRARLQELEAHIRRAAESGQNEQAERLQQEAERLAEQLEQFEQGPLPIGPERSRPAADGERAMLLRRAIESLHAAGFHDHARRLEEEFHELLGPGPREGGPQLQPPRFGPGGPFGGRPEGMENLIQGLREELRQMRRELDELRSAVRGGQRSGGDQPRDRSDRPRGDSDVPRDGESPRR